MNIKQNEHLRRIAPHSYDERAYFLAQCEEYEKELKTETNPEAIKALLSCINMIHLLLEGK